MLPDTFRGTAERRAIVGILGRTFEKREDAKTYDQLDHASKAVIFDAEDVAVLLTRLQHLVLTGGSLRRPEVSVKYRSLRAAVLAGCPGAPARTIGILPGDISSALNVVRRAGETTTTPNHDSTSLDVHTQLKGRERDAVTGSAADVFIALKGVAGTPREVAAALVASRPIVFLKSADELREATREELRRQHENPDLFPARPVMASDAVAAVELALSAVGVGSPNVNLLGALRNIKHMSSWPNPVGADRKLLEQLEQSVHSLLAG